jgi:hypothetical protein
MISSKTSVTRSTIRRAALIALGCAFSLAIVPMPALQAADTAPKADKSPILPLTTTFEKVAVTDNGPPFVAKLKNDSKGDLAVTTKVLLSVAFHANDKARNLPEHVIKAGQTWTVPDLAANDKLIITAKGFAPLELTVH